MEKKHTVGIFSRSDRKDYGWLISILTSQECSDWVQDVRSTVISNTLTTFIGDASQCTFGILYHTKNRGGVNISDVTGSLYDEEMKILYELLGKENFIVVIDDLKDSSDEEKRRILNIQPSIYSLACDLLLISNTEKTNAKTLVTKLRNLRLFHSTSETWNSNKNPEMSSRCESPKAWKNTSEVQMNVCAPVMSSRSEDGKEPIYMNLISIFDSSEGLNNFDNPESWDSIENPKVSSSNENLKIWDSPESCETVNRYDGPETSSSLETLDTGNVYTDPIIPFPDKLFEEMREKFLSKENSETKSSYKNFETVFLKGEKTPTGCSYKNSEPINNKSPERQSNTQKPMKWLHNVNGQTWCRNETLPSDNNPDTPSTSTPGSYDPQPSKGNLRTHTETLTKNKDPERRSNNEKPIKLNFNESGHTWYRNEKV